MLQVGHGLKGMVDPKKNENKVEKEPHWEKNQ